MLEPAILWSLPESASKEFRSFIGCSLIKDSTHRCSASQLLTQPLYILFPSFFFFNVFSLFYFILSIKSEKCIPRTLH
ncbi:hypothetical protein AAZX31_08G054600 [Glycine max]